MNLVVHHLKWLATFRGRENRKPFWLWVAIVMGAAMAAWMAVFVPFFIGIFQRIEQFARDHPDQVTRTVGPGSYSIQVNGYHPELMPDFGGLIGGLMVIMAVVIVLLAAAVARRLQDSGRSGWWGIAPLPFLAIGMGLASRIFTAVPKDADGAGASQFFTLFGLMLLNNVVYLGTLITLVIFLGLAGTPGPNRYGEDPLGVR